MSEVDDPHRAAVTRAIELYFDADLEREVRSLWQRLADARLPSLSTFTHGRHRPHVSLTVAARLNLDGLRKPLADIVSEEPLRIVLEHVALFPGSGVLFLGVVPTSAMLDMHARVGALIRKAGIEPWPHYVAGTWVPHVTLAMGLNADQVPAAVSLCHRHARAIAGRVEEVGCTEVDTGACDLIVERPS